MAEIDGNTIIARALKTQGVEAMFGVVGIPVTTIAAAAQKEGIEYIGMRHEMPANYAAQAVSYLGTKGRIGAALNVSGPGVLNAVGAYANAWSNRWPMLLLGGSYEQNGHMSGFFQEADQLTPLRPFSKYAERAERIERLPIYIAEAVKKALHGVPGPSYIDLPGDLIAGTIDEDKVQWAPRVPDPKRTQSDPADVRAAIEALKTADSAVATSWPCDDQIYPDLHGLRDPRITDEQRKGREFLRKLRSGMAGNTSTGVADPRPPLSPPDTGSADTGGLPLPDE